MLEQNSHEYTPVNQNPFFMGKYLQALVRENKRWDLVFSTTAHLTEQAVGGKRSPCLLMTHWDSWAVYKRSVINDHNPAVRTRLQSLSILKQNYVKIVKKTEVTGVGSGYFGYMGLGTFFETLENFTDCVAPKETNRICGPPCIHRKHIWPLEGGSASLVQI